MDRVVLVSRAYQTQSDAVFRVVYRAGRDSGEQDEMENLNRNLMSPVAELAWRESALVEPTRAEPMHVEPTRVEPKAATEDTPLVSVVIPSYNSARTIRKCLCGLSAQRTTLPFEVIIADSSADGVLPELRATLESMRPAATSFCFWIPIACRILNGSIRWWQASLTAPMV